MSGSRVDQERIKVVVGGIDLGIFQTFAGGSVSSDDTKNRPGGMGDEESLGGPKSRDAFTLSRVLDLESDLPLFKTLDAMCGSARVTASRQKLRKDKSPIGDPIVYTGTLMKVSPPDSDSNASDRAEFTLEVSADEAIS
jgi:hypothetical protein